MSTEIMMRKNIHEKNLNIKINGELRDNYRSFCEEMGFCPSKRIRNFIEQELKTKKEKKEKV